ncbi:ScbR family autoregulator-binding transcription factor [Streptomyces sp. NPDC102402]|uniref:ScbR family autoregulator-binding transcription factor n=1 Tax=Streptomyces sp. NPDC102402 TaxID=3366169 RepID=UPI0038248788
MSNERNGQSTRLSDTPFDDTSHLKQQRAIRTRGIILNAAAKAFATDGFPQVTVKDIADGAEMTKGAVYFHFPNKEALAVAVLEVFYGRMQDAINGALEHRDPSSTATFVAVLRRLARAFQEDVFIHAGARLQIERPYIKAELPVPYVGTLEVLTDLLDKCRKAGSLPEDTKPEAMARALGSAVFGAQHISWVLNNREDVVERVDEIIEAFVPLR